MTILTAEENSEADALLNALLQRVQTYKHASPFSRYLKRIHRERNLDLLRCMDNLLTSSDPELFFSIERAQMVSHFSMGKEDAHTFLTAEMVSAEQKLQHYFSTVNTTLSSADAATIYLFSNMEHMEIILHLIKDRNITDMDVLDGMLKGMISTDQPKSLLSGVI